METITVIPDPDRASIDILSAGRTEKRTAASLVFGTDESVTAGCEARYTITRDGQTVERIASKRDGDVWRIDAEFWNGSACPTFMNGTFSVMSRPASDEEQFALNLVVR